MFPRFVSQDSNLIPPVTKTSALSIARKEGKTPHGDRAPRYALRDGRYSAYSISAPTDRSAASQRYPSSINCAAQVKGKMKVKDVPLQE